MLVWNSEGKEEWNIVSKRKGYDVKFPSPYSCMFYMDYGGNEISMIFRQPAEWEKVFAHHVFDKGWVSRKYKELLQLNDKKK